MWFNKQITQKEREKEEIISERREEERRCGAFLLKRVQRGAEKQQTAAPNGFSLFVMRLLLLLLPAHVLLLGRGWMSGEEGWKS